MFTGKESCDEAGLSDFQLSWIYWISNMIISYNNINICCNTEERPVNWWMILGRSNWRAQNLASERCTAALCFNYVVTITAFRCFEHLSASFSAKHTVHLAGTPTTAQCSPCDHWGKQRFSFCWGQVGIYHIWIHSSMMWLFDTFWYFLKVNMAWFKRTISNIQQQLDAERWWPENGHGSLFPRPVPCGVGS